MLTSLLCNTAMAYGCKFYENFEGIGIGVRWGNMGETRLKNEISFGEIVGFLILDGFLYLILAIYLEAVLPREYGVPLPFYFPFMVKNY